jgi:flagellar biosynthesis/type III secretory pathway protein FliH
MVNARRESYRAGVKVGFDEGYRQGYEMKCTEIHNYYKTIINALELKIKSEELKSFEEGTKWGMELARGGDT